MFERPNPPQVVISGAIVAVLAISAFVLGREYGPGHSPNPSASAATIGESSPVALPAPAQEWQAQAAALEQADKARPRIVQTLNGITIGPGVRVDDASCVAGEGRFVDPALTSGTAIALEPRFLPPRVVLREDSAVACGTRLVAHDIDYGVAADNGVISRMAAGESWFDTNHGGTLYISRKLTTNPAVSVHGASESCRTATIGGYPAIVCSPLDVRGFGKGEVIVWEIGSNVLTHVRGTNVSENQLVQIAEGLF